MFFRSTLAAAAAASLSRRDALAALYRPVSVRSRDVIAVTGDGREVTLTTSVLTDLQAKLRGRLLVAGDDGYDDAR
jgi:hypothetical protein